MKIFKSRTGPSDPFEEVRDYIYNLQNKIGIEALYRADEILYDEENEIYFIHTKVYECLNGKVKSLMQFLCMKDCVQTLWKKVTGNLQTLASKMSRDSK